MLAPYFFPPPVFFILESSLALATPTIYQSLYRFVSKTVALQAP